jgi:hypothetical protein
MAEPVGYDAVKPVADMRKAPEHEIAPEDILANEEAEVGEPGRSQEALARLGGKHDLKGAKNKPEEQEAEAGVESD